MLGASSESSAVPLFRLPSGVAVCTGAAIDRDEGALSTEVMFCGRSADGDDDVLNAGAGGGVVAAVVVMEEYGTGSFSRCMQANFTITGVSEGKQATEFGKVFAAAKARYNM